MNGQYVDRYFRVKEGMCVYVGVCARVCMGIVGVGGGGGVSATDMVIVSMNVVVTAVATIVVFSVSSLLCSIFSALRWLI